MGEETFRVLAALRELDAELDDPPPKTEVASRSAVSIGDAERELDRLAAVGAAEEIGGERYEPAETTVEEVASRIDTVEELDADEREALLEALQKGDADPDVLYDAQDARQAAERATDSESAG